MKPYYSIFSAIAAICLSVATVSCSDDNDDTTAPEVLKLVSSTGNRFTGEGGTLEILINSNVDYTVATDADWITRVVSRSAPINGTELFRISPYPTANDMTPRSGSITISYSDTDPIVYTVEQTPAETFRFKIAGISADRIPSEGGELTVTLDTNLEYTVSVSDPSWITFDTNSTRDLAKFLIAENTGTEERAGEIKFTTAELGETSIGFIQRPFGESKGISSASQLIEFATAVNTGISLEPWLDENEEVVLLTDIDMTGHQWTPIGNLRGSTFSNGATTLGSDGHAFTGVFNGNGHSIRNLAMSTDAEQCFGLFGVCSSATVKNLVIDTSCTLQVTNEGMTSACAYGFIAGLIYQSTIENVTVHGTVLESLINKGSSKFMGTVAGIAGYSYASTVSHCTFAGTIKHVRSNMYDNSVGSGTAGIIGFSRGSSSVPTTIENCVNSGYIYAETNRVAGILGSTNGNFVIRDCENSGIVHGGAREAAVAGWSSGLRVGGILGFSSNTKATTQCVIERCTNSGTVVTDADAKTQTGGIIGLVRNLTLTDVTNSGCVIATPGSIAGLICGQLQCADKPTINSCNVSGRFANSYTGTERGITPVDPVTITAENYFQYSAGNITGTNSSYWTTDKVKFK